MKRPAHGAFSGKSDSSGSSFAKLCGGGFRVRSGISSQKIRTFFKKIKNFQKKINGLFKKRTRAFLNTILLFLKKTQDDFKIFYRIVTQTNI